MQLKSKAVFIAWNSYHTRNESISNVLGIKNIHVGKKQSNILLSAISFIPKSIKTILIFKKEKPNILIVTNNAWVLPALSIILCKLTGTNLIFDTHSCGIVSNQIKYPNIFKRYFAKLADFSLVTNEKHAKIVRHWGGNAFVLPDPPLDLEENKTECYNVSDKINICYINMYAFDEPYTEVVNAVKDMNDVMLYITGNYINNKKTLSKSENIVHTGFLKRPQYIDLLKKSDIIMVLTTRENTFQCGGNEALSLGKPLITSNTKMLTNYFRKGAIFVNPCNSESINNGIEKMITNLSFYENEMKELKKEKELEAHNKINQIIDIINQK